MSKHALFLFTALAWCGAAGGLAAAPPAGDAPAQRPLVGAIRWDAWLGDSDKIGRAVESALSPEKWHSRLPFYAKVEGRDRVRIDGTAQAVVEREIDYAVEAGLDYWTFGADSLQSPLSEGAARLEAIGKVLRPEDTPRR